MTVPDPNTDGATTMMRFLQEQAAHFEHLASTPPRELHGRLVLVQSLLQRLDQNDPRVLMVLRAAQGWSIEDLLAGELGTTTE